MKPSDIERIWGSDICRDGGSYGFCFDAKDGHWYEFFLKTRAFEQDKGDTTHHPPAIFLEGQAEGAPVQRLTWKEAQEFVQPLSFENARFAELVAIVQAEGRRTAAAQASPMPQLAFDSVRSYVRAYRNPNGEVAPYDVNGVIHLMLAALDNLCEHMIEGDFEQFSETVTEHQRQAFIRLAAALDRDGGAERD